MPSGFRINPRPPKIDQALLESFRGLPTPIVSDNMARMYAGGSRLRPYYKGAPMLGVALTVNARPGDNLMVHKAIDIAEPGDIIVVDAGGDMTNAIFGEIMLRWSAKRGVGGIVIDGAIRDSDVLTAGDFPVFAAGVTHRGPYKDGPGEINVPVKIGGQIVAPGDIVIGDADGVLGIPRADAKEVAALAHAQFAREAGILAAIADGSVDRRWVDELLRAKGLAL